MLSFTVLAPVLSGLSFFPFINCLNFFPFLVMESNMLSMLVASVLDRRTIAEVMVAITDEWPRGSDSTFPHGRSGRFQCTGCTDEGPPPSTLTDMQFFTPPSALPLLEPSRYRTWKSAFCVRCAGTYAANIENLSPTCCIWNSADTIPSSSSDTPPGCAFLIFNCFISRVQIIGEGIPWRTQVAPRLHSRRLGTSNGPQAISPGQGG